MKGYSLLFEKKPKDSKKKGAYIKSSVSAGKQLCDLSLPKSVTATFKALFLIFFF
jgi:hypothetical protein